LTEHHVKDYEIDITPITKYKLGAKYCRKISKNGGVSIYIQEYLKFININLQNYCNEQDIKLRSKNACGHDGISNRILKLSAPFIIFLLIYICTHNAVVNTVQ
jgi:hypothetical protein